MSYFSKVEMSYSGISGRGFSLTIRHLRGLRARRCPGDAQKVPRVRFLAPKNWARRCPGDAQKVPKRCAMTREIRTMAAREPGRLAMIERAESAAQAGASGPPRHFRLLPRHSRPLPRHSGETGCVKTPKIQSRTKKFPTGMANIRHSCAGRNPAYQARASRSFAGISDSGRGGPSGAAMCAFRALFARDSCFRRNGGVGFICWMSAGFLHSLESRNPA